MSYLGMGVPAMPSMDLSAAGPFPFFASPPGAPKLAAEAPVPSPPSDGYVPGAAIEAWSKSNKKWCPGAVESVEGNMVYVNFKAPGGECYRKGIPKGHEHLRLAAGQPSAPQPGPPGPGSGMPPQLGGGWPGPPASWGRPGPGAPPLPPHMVPTMPVVPQMSMAMLPMPPSPMAPTAPGPPQPAPPFPMPGLQAPQVPQAAAPPMPSAPTMPLPTQPVLEQVPMPASVAPTLPVPTAPPAPMQGPGMIPTPQMQGVPMQAGVVMQPGMQVQEGVPMQQGVPAQQGSVSTQQGVPMQQGMVMQQGMPMQQGGPLQAVAPQAATPAESFAFAPPGQAPLQVAPSSVQPIPSMQTLPTPMQPGFAAPTVPATQPLVAAPTVPAVPVQAAPPASLALGASRQGRNSPRNPQDRVNMPMDQSMLDSSMMFQGQAPSAASIGGVLAPSTTGIGNTSVIMETAAPASQMALVSSSLYSGEGRPNDGIGVPSRQVQFVPLNAPSAGYETSKASNAAATVPTRQPGVSLALANCKYRPGDTVEIWSNSSASWRPGRVTHFEGDMVHAEFFTMDNVKMLKAFESHDLELGIRPVTRQEDRLSLSTKVERIKRELEELQMQRQKLEDKAPTTLVQPEPSPPAQLTPASTWQQGARAATALRDPAMSEPVGVMDCMPQGYTPQKLTEAADFSKLKVVNVNESAYNRPAPNSDSPETTMIKAELRQAVPVVEERKAVKFASAGDMLPGDRVEFCYEGQWLAGALRSIEGDIANVDLDVDKDAGCVTKGPVSLLRPAKSAAQQPAVAVTTTPNPQAAEQACDGLDEHEQVKVKYMKIGERVELNYDGRWMEGILQSMVGETVYVKLDADGSSGCVAKAPLSMIRWIDRGSG